MFVKLTTGRSAFALTLTGALDGAVTWPGFDKLPNEVRGGMVVVDVGGVSDASPRGVQSLLRALPSVPAQRRLLVNVRPQVLSALALSPGVVDVATIGSAWLPLVCASCGKVHEQLLDLRVHEAAARAFALPGFRCPDCGSACALQDDPLVLLAPFAEQPTLSLPDGIEAFWPPPRAASAARMQVEIDVAGADDVAVTAVWLAGTLSRVPALTRLAPRLSGTVVVVADDVHATSAAGLEALRELFTVVPNAWLARLSLPLAQGLSTTLSGFGNAAVASMRLPFRCPGCDDTVLIDVDLAERERIARQQTPPCPRCATSLSAAFGEREVMALQTMPLRAAPPEVSAYLFSHLHPPSHDRQSQWTQVVVESPVPSAPAASMPPTKASSSDPPPASPSSNPNRPGTTRTQQATRYEVLRRLGVGGMAETLLGRQTGIGGFEKRVVIKRILPALANKPDFVDMFLHEARVAARINHSNVVQIFDFGRAKGEYYIVMEYVKGYDLSAILKEAERANRPVPIEIAIRIICDLCAGLAAAHSAHDEHGHVDPIIHRDVSPHNVMLSSDGATKLADFGIAKPQSMVGSTKPGDLKGKIIYMAPEALRNESPTTKLDIYAAGMILYTLLAGKNPYTRPSEVQSMYAVAHEGLPPIITARRDVPFSLAATLGRAVARDPSGRFASAQALQLHLEAFLGELGRPATPMHVALWVNDLMAKVTAPAAQNDGTPSSSLELLEIGTLTPGEAELSLGNVSGLSSVASKDGRAVQLSGILFDKD